MTKTAVKTVGVVGAGRMGTPIVGHLVRKGFATRVFDLDATRAGAVKKLGAQWAAGAESLAAACEAILVCVGFDREVQELLAKGGPLRKAKPGAIVAILSTIHPRTVQNLAKECESAGLHVVDSTVCRGGEAADSGTLLSFVGGSAELVERLTPVLRAYSSDVVHTGGVGTAQVAKAVNNLILWACLVADHEGLALAQLRERAAREVGQPDDGLGRRRHGDRRRDGSGGGHCVAASGRDPRDLPRAKAAAP